MEKSFIIVYQTNEENLKKAFKENGIDKYMILNQSIAVIYVPINFNEKILVDMLEIGNWQPSKPMNSLIKITDEISQGETPSSATGIDYIYKNPYINPLGEGVIIAIIDSGINYLHPDFINKDGKTKIISIWDQNYTRQNEGNNTKANEDKNNQDDTKEKEQNTNEKSNKYLYGREISRDEINEAIKTQNPSLIIDNTGTGTIAAGICCGNGSLNSAYRGIAVESELVVVKLKEYKDTYVAGRINYQSSDFLAAIRYVLDVAIKEGKMLIVNLTVGQTSASASILTYLDTFDYLSQSGVIVVAGAGNEGNTDIHYEGVLTEVDKTEDIIVQVGEQLNLEIVLCVNGPDKIGAEIISPAGEISYRAEYSPEFYTYSGKFDLENTYYTIQFKYPFFESGSERLVINLMGIKPGVWTLRLVPEFLISGQYHVYLPNKALISKDTRFLDPNSRSTITGYATDGSIITIGTYDNKTDSIWIGSSKGPVNQTQIKPDIVAPGVDIIGPYKDNLYNTALGSGVSSSIVCGVLAIIMNYIKDQGNSRGSLFTSVLKTYLMLGATKKDIYTYPNMSQGYGILNLKETIIQIANNIE